MSDRDAFRAEPGDDLKTPDEWCKLLGYEVMDPDGWRGSNGRPWTDPISQAEFETRLVTCTQRRVDPRAAFRAEQQTRRQFGKAKQHEKRLENATYTAAEVKVLTETAAEAGRRIGRKEASEEIVALIKDYRRALNAAFAARGHEQDAIKAEAAAKTPPEPCEYCGLTDDHKGGCPQTGEAPRPGAPG